MVRQTGRETGESPDGRWPGAADRLGAAIDQFRETRLFAQAVMALFLTVVALVGVKVPLGPLRRAVVWVGTHDSDFVGSAARAQAWAQARGGWVRASVGAWDAGVGRMREWIGMPADEPGPLAAPAEGRVGLAANSTTGVVVGPGVSESPASQQKPLIPVDGGALLFGFGWPPPGTGNQFHEGLDLVAAQGAPVVAVADGKVTGVRLDPKRGRLIEVDHGTILAVYAQVDGVKVSVGQTVRRGQVIAVLAQPAGLEQTQPPHLHFEVRTRSGHVAVDPAAYLGLGGTQL